MTHFRNTALALVLTSLALTLASGCGGGSGSSEDKIAVTPVSITSFGSSRTSLLYGERTTLSAVFSGGTGRVTPGDLAISSGTPLEVQPTATTTYTLTVTGGPGSTPQSRTVAVDVATVAVSSPSAGATQVEAGGSTTISASVTGALDANITWTVSAGTITAGQGTGTITWTAPTSVQTVTVTATSVADPTKSASTQVQVVAVQVAPSNLTYPAVPRLYRGLGAPTLTPTVSGTAPMTFAVSPALPAGLALNTSTGAITGTPSEEAYGTYTVTATNSVGSTTAQVTLEIGNPPLIFEVGSPRINRGNSTILSWNAASGEGVYDRATLTASPEDPSLPTGTLPLDTVISVSPTAPSTTYSLTAHGLYGGAVSATQVIETSTAAASIIDLFGQDWATYGQTAEIKWRLAGIPDTLTLNGENVLGQSTALVTPRRRLGFTLEARNAYGSDAKTFQVAARGLDTWAGQPLAFGAQDGPVESAQFYFATTAPTNLSASNNLSLDGAGNLYVADTLSHTIRMVSSTGVVTTLAGKAGASGNTDGVTGVDARFNSPTHVLVWTQDGSNAANVLMVADSGNNTIRRLTRQGDGTWMVTLEAGTAGTFGGVTTQDLYAPTGLAKYNDKLFIADRRSNSIRIYDPAAQEGNRISLLCGGAGGTSFGFVDGDAATARFNAPSSLAIDPSNGDVYVADRENHVIRKVTQAGVASTVAGTNTAGFTDANGTAARFSRPTSIVRDAAGNFFISESGNHAIRKMDASLEVTTLAGTGSAGFAEGTGTSAVFNGPQGITLDAAGNLLVADSVNGHIRKLTASGSPASYTTSPYAGRRWAGTADGQGEAAQFDRPNILAVSADGTAYVTDVGNRRVRRVSPAGEVTTFFTPATGTPTTVALDPAGQHLYVAVSNLNPGRIDRISLTDGTTTTLTLSHPLGTSILGLAVSPDGTRLYTAEPTGRLRRYEIATGTREAELPGQTGASRLAVATNGVYWTTGGTTLAQIRKANLDLTAPETVLGTAGVGFRDGDEATAQLSGPQQMALVLDEDGAATGAWIADGSNHAIRYVDFQARTLWTLAGSPTEFGARAGALEGGGAALSNPRGLALTPQGDLLVTTSDAVMLVTLPILP